MHHEIPCPHLDQYILDKKLFRISLADELGVSVPQVKAMLLALGYGAGVTPWRFISTDEKGEEKYKPIPSAIHETLGVKSEAFDKALTNKKIAGLKTELDTISDRMLDEAKRMNGMLINVRGLLLPIYEGNKEIRKSKQKAHIVQGIESQLLKSLISALAYGHKTGRYEYVILALHDGCVCRVKRDTEQVKMAVANGHAGIEINIDCERYKLVDVPLD